jgi:hypothetical protein
LTHITNPLLLSEDPVQRLSEAIKIFPSDYMYYGIHKAENFKRINRELKSFVTEHFIFQEYYLTYGSIISGPVASPIGLKPIIVRQEDTSQLAKILIESERLSFLVTQDSWATQLNGLKEHLKRLFNDNNPKHASKFELIFDRSFHRMLRTNINNARLGSYLKAVPLLYDFAVRLLALSRGKRRLDLGIDALKEDSELHRLEIFLRSHR